MELSNNELRRAEDGILKILEHSEESFQPALLMKQLEEQGISSYSARVAIWYLIDRNRIELTMDRLLKSAKRDQDRVHQRLSLASG